MRASAVLGLLLKVAEKASNIAKIIRKEKLLVELLVEEKSGVEKNSRFFQDFKTLADVLIQETVCYYISKEVPNIRANIYGEESNTFTNVEGRSITVRVCDSLEETRELLSIVLGGNIEAAQLLAEAVHITSTTGINVPDDAISIDIPMEDCGIWIDPLDSTGQYIKGERGEENEHGMVVRGLQCVAILIGVFQKSSGKPILGVIAQPFAQFEKVTKSWTSSTMWGICYQGVKKTSHAPVGEAGSRVVLSNIESELVQKALATKYDLVFASGAGYKLLACVLGFANAYVLSHRSIYRWDCCAVHPLLQALGGGIVSYKHALEAAGKCQGSLTEEDVNQLQVNYTKAAGAVSNRRNSVSDSTESLPGIIAYRSVTDVLEILELLKTTLSSVTTL